MLWSQCGRGRQGWQPSVGAGAARAREKGCPTRPKRMSRDRWAWRRENTVAPPAAVALLSQSRCAARVARVFLHPEVGRTSYGTGSHDGRELGRRPGGLFRHSVTSRSPKAQHRNTTVSAPCSSKLATGIAASLVGVRVRPLRPAPSPSGSASAALVVKHGGRRIPIVLQDLASPPERRTRRADCEQAD